MTTVEQINQQVQKLPELMQEEVLDFAEFLMSKTKRENSRQEDLEWSSLSLAAAMRDIEDEDEEVIYNESDLRRIN